MAEDQVTSFRAKNREYELFFADDGFIELYDSNNPNEGFYFKDRKELVVFMNTLTDVLEKMEMEKIWN